MNELDRIVGEHTAKIEALSEDVKSIKSDIAEIKEFVTQSKARWALLVMVMGGVAAAGAAADRTITWVVTHYK